MKNKLILFISALLAGSSYSVEPIKPIEANQRVMDGKAILIDVREENELKETGMAAPAKWLAKSDIDKNTTHYQSFLKELDKNFQLIFYCRSGNRAGIVAKHFEGLGFSTFNAGGLSDWVAAKLPIKKY